MFKGVRGDWISENGQPWFVSDSAKDQAVGSAWGKAKGQMMPRGKCQVMSPLLLGDPKTISQSSLQEETQRGLSAAWRADTLGSADGDWKKPDPARELRWGQALHLAHFLCEPS